MTRAKNKKMNMFSNDFKSTYYWSPNKPYRVVAYKYQYDLMWMKLIGDFRFYFTAWIVSKLILVKYDGSNIYKHNS